MKKPSLEPIELGVKVFSHKLQINFFEDTEDSVSCEEESLDEESMAIWEDLQKQMGTNLLFLKGELQGSAREQMEAVHSKLLSKISHVMEETASPESSITLKDFQIFRFQTESGWSHVYASAESGFDDVLN